MRVLAISGSLRAESHNARLLRMAAGRLPAGVSVEWWDAPAVLPPFNEDAESEPPLPVVAAARAAVARADAVLVASPEYNASVPGVLKNALDWTSRPFATNPLRRKPVAVFGTSPGIFGGVWAHADARRILTAIGADVLDTELAVPLAESAFADDDNLADPELDAALTALVHELLARAAVAHATAA